MKTGSTLLTLSRLTISCLALALTVACAAPATPAVPPTLPAPTQTPAPTATLAPTAAPTPTVFSSPTPQANCTDLALFVQDVTIADNTRLEKGQAFTKTWQIRNIGTCTWNSTYKLVFIGGENMASPQAVPLAETLPGKTIDISVDLTAPARDGAFSSIYELRSPNGLYIPVGQLTSIWVKVLVGTGVSAAAAVPTQFLPAKTGGGVCQSSENAGAAAEIVGLINAARADAKLPALSFNGALSAAALAHSLDMGCNDFLDHRGSDGSWIGDRIAAAGYATYNYTEIIAIGSPQEAMNQWRNSASHWNAILDPTITDIGAAYVAVAGSSYGSYITVDLAGP
jgi:uncharacterized protein YkwD